MYFSADDNGGLIANNHMQIGLSGEDLPSAELHSSVIDISAWNCRCSVSCLDGPFQAGAHQTLYGSGL